LQQQAKYSFICEELEVRFNGQMKMFFFGALVPPIIIMFGLWRWDLQLAVWVAGYLTDYAPVIEHSNIPDLLMITVVILTSLSWTAYFYLVQRNIHDQNTIFCCVMGTVMPLSFGVKTVMKWLFGRIETRTWLSDPNLYGFHWFNGSEGFQGFPSGHMLVFTPMFLALWHFNPRYRLYYGMAWFCLGVALITTEYHFLSDVIAGAYIGAILYLAVRRWVR
jgi:membrane-associated phospholipid phosphatase